MIPAPAPRSSPHQPHTTSLFAPMSAGPRPNVLRAAALVPAGLALAAVPLAREIYFHPEDGTTLDHRMEIELSADLDDFEMTAMGQTVGPDEIGDGEGSIEDLAGEVDLVFSLTDEIARATRGRTLELVRTFGEMLVNGEEQEDTDEGPKQVRFTWSEDDGAHTVEVLDEDADEDDYELAQVLLTEDMSLLHLLPDGEVSEEESWSVELGADGLLAMFLPGIKTDGMAEFAAEKASEEEPEAAEFVEEGMLMLTEAFDDATAELTFVGTEELDGREVARMAMTTEFLASIDPSPMIERAIEMEEEAPDVDVSILVTLSGEGEGFLLWDVDGNHLHRMEIEGDWVFDVEFDATAMVEGMGEIPMDGVAAWSGTFTSVHTVTRAE